MTAILRNDSTGKHLATRVIRASGPWQRTLGLLGRRTVAPDEGMWFDRCGSVHTLGMRAALDVLFLDADHRVLRVVPGARPHQPMLACRGATIVVELGAGALDIASVSVGDLLLLEEPCDSPSP